MVLPGFFLECLVTGSCALLWLFGLFRLYKISLPLEVEAAHLVVLAPGLHVIGMLIDFCFGQPLSALSKKLLRKRLPAKSASEVYTSLATIWLQSTDLGKQIEVRSSRDRVARGAVGNLVIGPSFRRSLRSVLMILGGMLY